jgi:RNA polymerase sigma-70 factor, ECF subfamily
MESACLDFGQLVREHQSMVFSIAWNYLRDRSQAEDLAQEVFLQLHKNLAAMKSADHVRFWLRKVAGQRCIDHWRRQGGDHAGISLEDAPEPAVKPESRDPLLSRKLQSLVASLPAKPRMVVILRYQEEMEPEEIAQALNMPVRTVKSHLQRSLAMLREKMARSVGEIRI